MLNDYEIALLLQKQYDKVEGVFDYSKRIGVVSVAAQRYQDHTLILCEGSYNWQDWLSNVQAAMISTPIGRVHSGFYQDTRDALVAILPYIQTEKPVVFSGHSRGAPHANILALEYIKGGIASSMVTRVKFGEPHHFDQETLAGFQDSPQVSYWNYDDFLRHDPVGDVAYHLPLVAPYVPEHRTIINVPPAADDQWGDAMGWHHLTPNYSTGVKAHLGV